MNIKAFRDEVNEEVAAILATDFQIEVTSTTSVPHSDDGYITFPNFDAKTQGCKLIETCVLYIDIRRSTALNLSHKPKTVAKLYSSFVRAMARCATKANGHVRGIIGDRLMVIFDQEDCFKDAVECAVLMNSVSKYVIDKNFKGNEVKCGIGIDYGKMLVTKTGFRRNGHNQGSYRNLVWLGRPANVASKLTDIANKNAETYDVYAVDVAYEKFSLADFGLAFGLGPRRPTGLLPNWVWQKMKLMDFVRGFSKSFGADNWTHKDKGIQAFIETTEEEQRRPATDPILMTKEVYSKFKSAYPEDNIVKKGLITKQVGLSIPDYAGDIYGGNVIYPIFRDL